MGGFLFKKIAFRVNMGCVNKIFNRFMWHRASLVSLLLMVCRIDGMIQDEFGLVPSRETTTQQNASVLEVEDFTGQTDSSGRMTDFTPLKENGVGSPLPIDKSDESIVSFPTRTFGKKYFQRWAGPKIKTIALGRVQPIQDRLRTRHVLDCNGLPTTLLIEGLVIKYFSELGDVSVVDVTEGEDPMIVFKISGIADDLPIIFFKVSELKKPYQDEDGNLVSQPQTWENLADLQRSRMGRLGYMMQHSNVYDKFSYLPMITSVEIFFTYIDRVGNTRVIEVTHAAQGDSAYNIVTKKNVYPLEEVDAAGIAIGRALASFNEVFMQGDKTEAHGDLHLKNVFAQSRNPSTLSASFKRKSMRDGIVRPDLDTALFLGRTNLSTKPVCRVYFIDNETMLQKKRAHQYIDWDINALMFIPLLSWGWTNEKKMAEDVWQRALSFFNRFIAGYIDVKSKGGTINLKAITTYLQNITDAWLDTAEQIIEEFEGALQAGKKSFFKNVLTPDKDGNFFDAASEAFDRVWRHLEMDNDFFDRQTAVLNNFMKYIFKFHDDDIKIESIKRRLQTFREAISEGNF